MIARRRIIGPFTEIITMRGLSVYGPLSDIQLEIIQQGGVLVNNGIIEDVANFESLRKAHSGVDVDYIEDKMVLLPGLIDSHTHICYAGTREKDYAMRIAGKSYLEIAQSGGGIITTVKQTRAASEEQLAGLLEERCNQLLSRGITTCEVKSGYGLSLEHELKMLRVIQKVNKLHDIDLVATCLAAHTLSPDFVNITDYTQHIVSAIFPHVMEEKLASRADIFVEKGAFGKEEARIILNAARELGFDRVIHADQFSTGGSLLAAEFNAVSADHLEASTNQEIDLLVHAGIAGILLPGSAMGLGVPYPAGRKMLDKGMCIAIASDWNPGSAPQGDLLMQTAVFGAFEKMTTAETLAAITVRAAFALKLNDRGIIDVGKKAHLTAFNAADYREILYYQGNLKPSKTYTS